MAKEMSGVLTALTTPFNADNEIDIPVLKAVVDRSVNGGVDGIVAGGSTGEVGTMSHEERLQLVDVIIEHNAGRVPVIAQTGACSTAQAIKLTKAAEKAGADVIMLVTPFYEPISIDETCRYIADVAEVTDLPIMLYNIPGATGVNLDPETVRKLATEIPNVKYIKDSSADYEQALRLIREHGDVIDTYIGWDVYLYSALVEGAKGILAGAANVVPNELVRVTKLIKEGDLKTALDEWGKLYPVIDVMFRTAFIPAIKAGCALQGLDVGVPRQPVSALSAADTAVLKAALDGLK